MKILAIGDLHGRKPKIKFKDFDAVFFVGDVCSDKDLGPLQKKWVNFLKDNPESKVCIDEFIISKIGRRKLNQLEKKSLKEGRKILEKLNKLNKPIFMVGGNWDQSYGSTKIKDINKNDYNYLKSFLDWWSGNKINPKLTSGLENIKDCQLNLHKFQNYNILGYGLSSAPEKPSKRKKLRFSKSQLANLNEAYNKIQNKLKKAYNNRDKSLPTIFITHNIPYNTKLDVIKNKDSYAYKKHLGSTIARTFCNKYQPLLCLGGHIHEGLGKDKIKKTTVINPGFGPNANVLVEIRGNKIKKIKF